MTKEQFMELGLTDEQATKAAEASKEELQGFIPKSRFDEVNNTKKQLEKDIVERDAQLDGLKAVDAEGLQAEITRLQGENQTAKDDYAKELRDLQLTNAIKLALNGKVHDEELASHLIKKDELILSEEGKVVGLDDQITSLQESKAFLFKQDGGGEQEQQSGFQIGNPKPNNTEAINDAVASAFGNTDK